MEALDRFVAELELDPVVIVTHDWGVLVGLRWACDHPERVSALVISDGGFFSDRRWHDFANTMRTPGEGEQLIAGFTREGFDGLMKSLSSGIDDAALDEYWKGFEGDTRRQGHLELYRSGDFEKLEPYEGRLARAGTAGADPVGRARPLHDGPECGALPRGDPRLRAEGLRRRRAFRVGRRA